MSVSFIDRFVDCHARNSSVEVGQPLIVLVCCCFYMQFSALFIAVLIPLSCCTHKNWGNKKSFASTSSEIPAHVTLSPSLYLSLYMTFLSLKSFYFLSRAFYNSCTLPDPKPPCWELYKAEYPIWSRIDSPRRRLSRSLRLACMEHNLLCNPCH
jgi:hypothetical protein